MEDFLIELEQLDALMDGLINQWAMCDRESATHLRTVMISCQLVLVLAEKIIETYETIIDEVSMFKIVDFADIVIVVKDELYDKLLALNPVH